MNEHKNDVVRRIIVIDDNHDIHKDFKIVLQKELLVLKE